MDLKELGFTKEELQGHVVRAIVEQTIHDCSVDDEGEPHYREGSFLQEIRSSVKAKVDKAVDSYCEEIIFPKVKDMMITKIVTQTNRFGEIEGDPEPLTDYVVKRIMAYLESTIDRHGHQTYDGKPRIEIIFSGAIEKAAVAGLQKQIKMFDAAVIQGMENAMITGLKDYATTLKTK